MLEGERATDHPLNISVRFRGPPLWRASALWGSGFGSSGCESAAYGTANATLLQRCASLQVHFPRDFRTLQQTCRFGIPAGHTILTARLPAADTGFEAFQRLGRVATTDHEGAIGLMGSTNHYVRQLMIFRKPGPR
jgi:hypothetical protein